jgi:hypothetical protein
MPGRVNRRLFCSLVAAVVTLVLGAGTERARRGEKEEQNHKGGDAVNCAGAEVGTPVPKGVDMFNLNLGQTRALSNAKNFEVVGHSYFKGPWLTQFARDNGLGISANTSRVYGGIGYFGGYNSPPIMFGTLIADVRDPRNMQPLSFIPCEPGTRCPYIRVNNRRKILVGTHDTNAANPTQPTPGQPARAGVSFHDVSDPRSPRELGFFLTRNNGNTHGFEIDDRFAYVCASLPSTTAPTSQNQEVVIIDYNNARNPVLASTVHVTGNRIGEPRGPMDDLNPNGTRQQNWCHEIHVHHGRLYVAWRDAGAVVIDVQDPYNPSIISRLDYVPPYNGGSLGAAHTYMPVVPMGHEEHPTLAVLTDEIFDCPPGFGRIVDVSYPNNPLFISTYRLPHVDDNFHRETGKFECPDGQQSIHHVSMDHRTTGLIYQAWYDQGLRAWDISNPYLPCEVGYYVSPKYAPPGRVDRHTREAYQDPETGLMYMTDGNGGGITVLRWTGPLPPAPLPATPR